MRVSDFHYELPPELIARYPLPERSTSRLLCLDGRSGAITHAQFPDFIARLTANDLLVLNNTRVIPARLFGMKASGGKVEMLIERILDEHRVLAHLRCSKTPRPQMQITFGESVFEVLGRCEDLFELRCLAKEPVAAVIDAIGEIPLPPYFQRAPEAMDKERYQTVYAEHKGSVAAPTAGLHFDAALFARLQELGIETAYVTLHVGAGTFAPVRVEEITQHRMHKEWVEVSAALCERIKATKARGGRIVAVGTTTVRSLESASRHGTIESFAGNTDIFIYPGYKFQCVDALITNFHLPSSTLLMLVSAFAGHANTMAAYQEAIRHGYRFYSYGDAMFATCRVD